MTPDLMKKIMDEQKLSNNDLATICDVSYRQIMYWLAGTYPIPRTVSFLLLAMNAGYMPQDWLVDALQKELKEHTL